MARILVNNRWYESLSSNAFLEDEYEKLMLDRKELLFPEFHAVNFRKLIQGDYNYRRPDFCLIDKKYSSWWVVEVELSHHSLYQHVLPQISVFANATYGADDADYLMNQDPSLDADALRSMMRGEQPGVLVIVNTPKLSWKQPLEAAGALLTIAEVFRSEMGKDIIRVNCEYPRTPDD